MLEFNPAGYVRFFQRVAELLRRNPRVKGIVGTSWLVDPVLEQISPELSVSENLGYGQRWKTFSGRAMWC